MNSPALKWLLSGMLLVAIGFGGLSARAYDGELEAGTPVGLIDFDLDDGGFSVVNANEPGGPWSYDSARGSWGAFDQDGCGRVAFRSSRLNSPIYVVPAAGNVTLAFQHRFSFEVDTTRWDGGQVRISVNHGPYVTVPLARFALNGYNNTVGGADVPNNELTGQLAFTAESTGYTLGEYISSIATLGPFAAHDFISIQFLAAWDDCSQGKVPNWEIDSVQFTPAVEEPSTPPVFTEPALPADAMVAERTSHTLKAVALGYTSYQWYLENVAIPGANSSNHTIVKMSAADAGHYYLVALNNVGSSTSRVATITMIPDTTPPAFISGEWCVEGDNIIIDLTEPLLPVNEQGNAVTDAFIWFIERISGPGGDPGQPVTVGYAPGEYSIVMTPEPGRMDPAATYRVVVVAHLLDEAGIPNILPADSSVNIVCPTAISVGTAGAGPFRFDRAPRASQFSTFNWSGASRGTADTTASVDAKVKLFNAATINLPLSSGAGLPPAAAVTAQWASDGRYLVTSPTGVEGCALMARLRNDSGQTRTGLTFSYDYVNEFPVQEEVLGYLVYYSLSGAPNSWRPIPSLSGSRTSGAKSATLDLSATPWNAGALLYLLWADDNGSGGPDDANEIDNFTVSASRPAVLITYNSPNVVVTWPAGSGILQSKANLTDAVWTDVPGAGSSGSASVAASGPHKFFSLRAP